MTNAAHLWCFPLHHGIPAFHLFIHSHNLPPCFLKPHTLYFQHPFYHSNHTSPPGSLRQEVLQLQLSTKASQKGNSSSILPQLPVQELVELPTVHAVINPKVAYMLKSPCLFPMHWNIFNFLSLIHYLPWLFTFGISEWLPLPQSLSGFAPTLYWFLSEFLHACHT